MILLGKPDSHFAVSLPDSFKVYILQIYKFEALCSMLRLIHIQWLRKPKRFTSHRKIMGYKATFVVAIMMTCEIAMWIVLCKFYAPILAKSLLQLQSLYVNEPLVVDW